MAKDKTSELLAETYRNVQMGQNSLCDVTGKITDKFMLKNVTGQISGYAALTEKCEKAMRANNVTPKKESLVKRAMAKGGIMMNTLFDSSNAHIADMIVQGTTMGADSLERTMNNCRKYGCDHETLELCENVIKFERGAAAAMKDYTAK